MNRSNTNEDYKPIVSIVFIAINVAVFMLQTKLGGSEDTDTLLKMGAQYSPYIYENGEWYRLFTPIFLHIGVEHITGNMIALIAVGQYIEWYFGRVKYIIIYLLAGISGNVLTLLVDLYTQEYAISAGASGAISGLFGALLILAIDSKTKNLFSLPRVLFGLVLMLVPNFRGERINIMAHLGGMIGGFLVGLIFYLFSKIKNTSVTNKQ